MNNTVQTIFLCSLTLLILIFLYFSKSQHDTNKFSSYYNTDGSFAGFIQKKNSLFRACEFSSNGSTLSCSMWFDDNILMQGQNIGISEEKI